MTVDLSTVETADLRRELGERDRLEQERRVAATRAAIRERFGVCADCGLDWSRWERVDVHRILFDGSLGHEPGHHGDEYTILLTCPNDHVQTHPGLTWFKRPLPT